MTNETRQRIKAYQEALPGMKGRVAAAALGLVIAASLLVTGSYAWLTLSAAPEVQGLATTVTGNGSLEIALATSNTPPAASGRGDSTAAGKDVTEANALWGNLINLSDPSYGLAEVTLRPAALNGTTGLLTNPLYGVAYGEDGRVIQATTQDDFAYCYYVPGAGTTASAFVVDKDNTHWGVRAISTVKYENLEGAEKLRNLVERARSSLNQAKNNYKTITNEKAEPGKGYIESLSGLIQAYAQAQIDGNLNNMNVKDYVPNLYKMMTDILQNVYVPTGASYLEVANMYEFYTTGNTDCGYDLDSLCSAAVSDQLPEHLKNISSLKQFAQDYRRLISYVDPEKVNDKNSLTYWNSQVEGGVSTVLWGDIDHIIYWLVDTSTCTVNGYKMNEIASHALELIGNDVKDAKINDGALARLEQRLGERMAPQISITVDASKIVSFVGEVTLKAVVTTGAADPFQLPTDINTAIEADPGGGYKGDDAVAEDTYAMALDFWLRTNAGASPGAVPSITTENKADGTTVETTTNPTQAFLTLEGHVISTTEQVPVMAVGVDGKEYPAYTYTYQDKILSGYLRNGTHYVLVDNLERSLAELANEYDISEEEITKTQKLETVTTVTGYEGVNRVWSEEQMAWVEQDDGSISTTQGGGSCYIFYADNEADQKRFMELLGAMKVVFVDGAGRQIGFANMDTANAYALNGRVTVPLKLDVSQSQYLGADMDGNEIYGLMPLTKDAPTRVTALIYLDGNKLDNSMVLASGDIQGSLNVQFGSVSANLVSVTTKDTEGNIISSSESYVLSGEDSVAIEDEDVMQDRIAISAQVDQTEFEYDPDQPAVPKLTVTVQGVEPGFVEARWIRAISSTQGALQPAISLAENGGSWTADVRLDTPGDYVLRSVWVDGTEYPLSESIRVTVRGSSVNSLICAAIPSGSYTSIMTADSSYATDITLGFTSSAQDLKSVRGLFLDQSGRQVTVTFRQSADGATWNGTAVFTSSGSYTMKYVEINGVQYEIRQDLQPTLELMLGLKAQLRVTADEKTLAAMKQIYSAATPTRFTLDNNVFPDGVPLIVTAEILDNRGNPIQALKDVQLYYGKVGSSIHKLDANLKWNYDTGCYEGTFLVDQAGSYTFSNVKVGENTITVGAGATSIQAMPPENISYFDNHTLPEQTAPKGNAVMTIGLAYSNAAAGVEAVMVKTEDGTTQTVAGTMGGEDLEHQGGKSVNLWTFPVPTVGGTQDGTWRLDSLKLYGVYYNDVYYDEENPVTISLSGEQIVTRVVHKIYVTLSGSDQTFQGEFMADHPIDITLSVTDFDGQPLDGELSDLVVRYYLDNSSIADNAYGYSANLGVVAVNSTGFTKQSDTQYKLNGLNFKVAGMYRNVDLTFTAGGISYKSGDFVMKYQVNGAASDRAPTVEVKWSTPTVTIVGTDPAGATPENPNGGEVFPMNIHTGGSTNLKEYSVRNYYEPYTATVHYKVSSLFGYATGYTVPKATFRLSGAGNIEWAEIVLENKSAPEYSNHVRFSADNSNQTSEVGGISGSSRRVLGEVTVTDIVMHAEGYDFTMKLSHELELAGRSTAPAKVSYQVDPAYVGIFELPAGKNPLDSRTFVAQFPLLKETVSVYEAVGEVTSVPKPRTVTQNITWTTQESSGCGGTETKTHYGTVTYTYDDREETGTFKEILRTYETKTWTMTTKKLNQDGTTSTATKNAGTQMSIIADDNVIKPNVTWTDVDTGKTTTQTVTVEGPESSRVFKEGNKVINEPDGWTFVN